MLAPVRQEARYAVPEWATHPSPVTARMSRGEAYSSVHKYADIDVGGVRRQESIFSRKMRAQVRGRTGTLGSFEYYGFSTDS